MPIPKMVGVFDEDLLFDTTGCFGVGGGVTFFVSLLSSSAICSIFFSGLLIRLILTPHGRS